MIKRCTLWLTLVLLSLLASGATAAIYKHVDEYGNVTFSDEPPADNAKQVKLKSLNTTPAIQPRKQEPAEPKTETKEKEEPFTLRFAIPSNDYRAGPAEKSLTVVLLTNQKLEKGLVIQLLVDGTPFGEPSQSNNFNIPLNRALQGKRVLSANIVDSAGAIITSAEPRTIYVIRPPLR